MTELYLHVIVVLQTAKHVHVHIVITDNLSVPVGTRNSLLSRHLTPTCLRLDPSTVLLVYYHVVLWYTVYMARVRIDDQTNCLSESFHLVSVIVQWRKKKAFSFHNIDLIFSPG